ncbi:flagellar FliJ family protein [Paludicola sp. MB14-C6]|uniref:flagellar export protein FliJ n=1 Tax=Paludihabitans sp. MB14-C6 TaxID=3070656 RepID=UPI0027DB41EC|nr:flagellar FliJ family protein [Paludicola sp. MB14-C6]WMJ24247.1 flagellar FliJ family protein [Paludicola sp. MB14-C6]
MKKFSFSLEKVLNYKCQLLDVLKNELSVLQHELTKMENQIQQQEFIYQQSNNELVDKMNEGMVPGEISSYKIYLSNLNEQIKVLMQKKELQQMKIVKKQVEIVNMNIEIGSLDKLKEQQFESYRQALQKQEELFINEFIGNSLSSQV